jgi:hypothetical protein
MSLKTALIQIGAVAAGAFGTMAAINRLASSRRSERSKPTAKPVASGRAARPVVARAPVPPPSPPQNAPELRPGWSRLDHIELPKPTYWPAVLALGITFLVWGLVTSVLLSGIGLILFALALAGWIGDLRHGH